jgi:hypothetical protein
LALKTYSATKTFPSRRKRGEGRHRSTSGSAKQIESLDAHAGFHCGAAVVTQRPAVFHLVFFVVLILLFSRATYLLSDAN